MMESTTTTTRWWHVLALAVLGAVVAAEAMGTISMGRLVRRASVLEQSPCDAEDEEQCGRRPPPPPPPPPGAIQAYRSVLWDPSATVADPKTATVAASFVSTPGGEEKRLADDVRRGPTNLVVLNGVMARAVGADVDAKTGVVTVHLSTTAPVSETMFAPLGTSAASLLGTGYGLVSTTVLGLGQ